MANEVGTTLLNSLTNSTFDIGNMAKTLAEADVAGARALLEKKQTKTSTELDALKYLQTNLNAFNTYLTDLTSPDFFSQKSATSSDESIISVTASNSATTATYQIESRQLAQAHTVVANKTYSSPSDTISTGTLDISIGGQTHQITIDASNNTLEGLQKVINNGDYGITASIINNGGSYQLMFNSNQTGATGEFSLSGISDFDTDGFTTTAEAQDAVMVLNGLVITNSSNNFSDVLEGVSFQLNSAAIGTTKSITIGQDTQTVTDAITSFVDVYNQLDTILDELGKYDKNSLTEEEQDSEEYQYYGDLSGSSLLRSVKSQIRESMTSVISELSGNTYTSLADIGITFDREGQLELDQSTLSNALATDLKAVESLFSKGGSSDDPLVNVTGGSSETQTGSYTLDITQLAERATVAGGAVTTTTDERVSGDRVVDGTSALTIDAGATFDLDIGGTSHTIDLSGIAGTFASKDDVATAIQGVIDTQFVANEATVLYDITQARFEISAATGQGSATMSNISGLSNQGFSATDYAGEQLIDLAADASFDAVIDDSTSSTVTVQQGRYTLEELAKRMQDNINSNSEVQAANAAVSISTDGGVLSVSSNKFGAFSTVELTNFTNFANAGFTADVTDAGQNVDGTITTATGSLNIGAYADTEDGRKIKISDFAVIGTEDAEVRGLEFEVIGGAIGSRGTITYAQGFASQIEQTINDLFDADTGLVSQRIDSLNAKNESYDERSDKLDARYEKLELKYRIEFSLLQSLIASSQATRDQLTAQFSNSDS